MILTIDIGNTTISFCIHKNNQEKAFFKIASIANKTSDEYFASIKLLLDDHQINFNDIKQIALCSVVDEIKLALKIMIEKYFKKATLLTMQPKLKTKIDIAIDDTNELGNDILASAVAANAISKSKNFCIIDLGTATTLSITSQNKFLGVAIMPGVEKQFESLALTTSKLPKVTLQNINHLIGKNTQDSILCGVVIGQAFTINKFITEYKKKWSDLEVYLTGGYNEWLGNYFTFDFKLKPLLVHQGLKELITFNLK